MSKKLSQDKYAKSVLEVAPYLDAIVATRNTQKLKTKREIYSADQLQRMIEDCALTDKTAFYNVGTIEYATVARKKRTVTEYHARILFQQDRKGRCRITLHAYDPKALHSFNIEEPANMEWTFTFPQAKSWPEAMAQAVSSAVPLSDAKHGDMPQSVPGGMMQVLTVAHNTVPVEKEKPKKVKADDLPRGMIHASSSGWISLVTVVKETRNNWHCLTVPPVKEQKPYKVSKKGQSQLFSTVAEAEAWIIEQNK